MSFRILSRLQDHKRSIHDGKPYHCNECEYTCTFKGPMFRHIKRVHEMIRHPCDQCEYMAAEMGNLRAHIKSVHENIKRKPKEM